MIVSLVVISLIAIASIVVGFVLKNKCLNQNIDTKKD